MSAQQTLGDVGEAYALAQIIPLLPATPSASLGPGDDAAVLRAPDSSVVISSDMMIEGPDFRWDWSTPTQVGRKAVASNAADIAAMGATPTSFQICVAAPPTTPLSVLTELATGIAQGIALLAPGAGVSGGDLSSAPVVTLAITVLGDLGHRAPVTRSGARPGDVLAATGDLGVSHRGLRALQDAGGDRDALAHLLATSSDVAHHLAPIPPIALGVVASDSGATAMMDISDGLVLDATRMARASGVRIVLRPDYPFDRDVLGGGEDHALLATFPPGAPLPEGFIPLGHAERAQGEADVVLEGWDLTALHRGWDPFYDALAK